MARTVPKARQVAAVDSFSVEWIDLIAADSEHHFTFSGHGRGYGRGEGDGVEGGGEGDGYGSFGDGYWSAYGTNLSSGGSTLK